MGQGVKEEIVRIEEEIRRTPYNKATQRHIGRLKAKLARLREEASRRGTRKRGEGFAVRRAGHASVALIGAPSVGKSTLLNALAGTESRTGEYDFTTLGVIPGLMRYSGAEIQILDLPGIIEGASRGRGRGRAPLSVLRSADLILIMCDVFRQDVRSILKELHSAGIRVNVPPPDIRIKRGARGGISVTSTVALTRLDRATVTSILKEFRILNASVALREDADEERFIDAVLGNRIYVPAIPVLNKIDLAEKGTIERILEGMPAEAGRPVAVSAATGRGVEYLKEHIFRTLRLIRVYLRPPGGSTSPDDPLVLREGANVGDACGAIHRQWRGRFRYAQVWGRSARFPGQNVGAGHILQDGDILTVHLWRRGGTARSPAGRPGSPQH